MKKKTNNSKPLMLHDLIFALSYWGTAVRALLFSFIAAAVFVVALTEISSNAVENEVMTLIYVLGSFLVLDFGYVMIVRSYPMKKFFDVTVLLLADLLLAALYVVPKVVVDASVAVATTVDPLVYVIFVPIVVLTLRMLTAFLYTGKRP